jgi:hypothetical protein
LNAGNQVDGQEDILVGCGFSPLDSTWTNENQNLFSLAIVRITTDMTKIDIDPTGIPTTIPTAFYYFDYFERSSEVLWASTRSVDSTYSP